MTQYLNRILTAYFLMLSGEVIYYYFLINRFRLKIPKKKAFVPMLLCMNFMPLADSIQWVIYGENLVNVNSFNVIVIKLFILLCEIVQILFIQYVCQSPWYQTYMIGMPIHIIMLLPVNEFLNNNFAVYDNQSGITKLTGE